jgi:predicted DNA-binding protein
MARSKKSSDRHRQKTVSFRLPEALMERFRALARKNRRTLSGEAQVALESHLAAQELDSGVSDRRTQGNQQEAD